MYTSLAGWFHLITAPADYAEEARYVLGLLAETADAAPRHVLELGSGGGNLASHLKEAVTLTLTDLSEDMLAVSQDHNPECEHVRGDRRTLRLGRLFDAVVAHDAIVYYAYLLREGGKTRIVHDRHVVGVFPRDTWLRLLHEVGFEVEAVVDPWHRVVFAARRPLSSRG
jgi:SAM-dependent methyltransferase